MSIDFTALSPLLAWAASSAGAGTWMIFVSRLVSNLREGPWDEEHSLSLWIGTWLNRIAPFPRQLYVLLASFSLPVIVLLILNYVPAEVIAQFAGAWKAFSTLCILYIGQQGLHASRKTK